MSKAEEEEQARLERARAVGLFRYMLIREAADPALSTGDRGLRARRPVRGAGAGDPVDAGCVDPRVAPRRVRRAGPVAAAVPAADPAGGAGARGGAEEGEPGPDRGAGPADPQGAVGVGAR